MIDSNKLPLSTICILELTFNNVSGWFDRNLDLFLVKINVTSSMYFWSRYFQLRIFVSHFLQVSLEQRYLFVWCD